MVHDSTLLNRYITQLIEDLRVLQRKPVEPWFKPEEDRELDFSEVERYLSGGYEQQISALLDLQPEQFPPAHRLSFIQMQAVTSAYTQLLESWGICLAIPEAVPADLAYITAVGTLEREVFISQHGMVTLEFCNYIRQECPFGEWCHCEDGDDLRSDENQDNVDPSPSQNS